MSGATRMVTANDIVYGVKRTCDAATASDYAYVNYIIAGCQAANTGEGSVDDVAVVAIDDATVAVHPGIWRRLLWPDCQHVGEPPHARSGPSKNTVMSGPSPATSTPTVRSS
ncbi:MAG: hypothetical protein R2854_00170 [Caldilineaceae bacterium]